MAVQLGCCEKTVRTNIQAVNNFLEHGGFAARIEGKRGSGVRMVASNEEKQRLDGLLENSTLEIRPRLDHFYKGMLLLVTSHNPVTMDLLAAHLYTNKQQLQSDMKHWQNLMDPFELTLRRGRNVSIEGGELATRFFLMYSFYQLAPGAMKRKIEPEFLGQDRTFLKSLIALIGADMNCRLSDNAVRQASTYMRLMVARVRNGHNIPERKDAKQPLTPVMARVREQLERRYPVHLSNSEMNLLHDICLCGTRQWSSTTIEDYRPSKEALDATEALAQALFERFGERPQERIMKSLAILMENALARFDRQLATASPCEHLVKYEHMDSFMLLTALFHDAPQLKNIHLFSSDYARLTLSLLGYFQEANLQRPFRAGIIANTGIDQAVYAQQRIDRLTSMVRVTGVESEDDVLGASPVFLKELRSRYDFIITFDAIDCAFPTVNVNLSINEADVAKIVASAASISDSTYSQMLTLQAATQTFVGEDVGTMRLYDELTARGDIDMAADDFKELFRSQALFEGTTLIVTIFNKEVLHTTALLYQARNDCFVNGRRLNALAVLLVSEQNRDVLSSLTGQFRAQLESQQDMNTVITEFFS